MRHLEKVKPGGRGLAFVLPEGPWYYPLAATYYPHHEEFLGSALDTDEWTDVSAVSTATSSLKIAVGSSLAVLSPGTSTVGVATIEFRSAYTSGANLYNIPFRAMFVARIDNPTNISATTANDLFLGLRSTDDTHIAQFHLDFTSAGIGLTSMAAPVVNVEVRAGSSAAAFIASSAHSLFSTGAAAGLPRTASSFVGYVIELSHRGTWFGVKEDLTTQELPRLLQFFANPVPRIDQNYYLDVKAPNSGGGGAQSAGGTPLFSIDSITVEQLTPQHQPGLAYSDLLHGGQKSFVLATISATAAGALVTSGAGVVLGGNFFSSALAGQAAYVGIYDASAASTAIYDYTQTNSGASRLIWLQAITMAGSGTSVVSVAPPPVFPVNGIPFYRGLVVGGCSLNGSAAAAGATGASGTIVYRNERAR